MVDIGGPTLDLLGAEIRDALSDVQDLDTHDLPAVADVQDDADLVLLRFDHRRVVEPPEAGIGVLIGVQSDVALPATEERRRHGPSGKCVLGEVPYMRGAGEPDPLTHRRPSLLLTVTVRADICRRTRRRNSDRT